MTITTQIIHAGSADHGTYYIAIKIETVLIRRDNNGKHFNLDNLEK